MMIVKDKPKTYCTDIDCEEREDCPHYVSDELMSQIGTLPKVIDLSDECLRERKDDE
jgi:hypothetical protein